MSGHIGRSPFTRTSLILGVAAFLLNFGFMIWLWHTRFVPVDLQFLGVVGGIVIEAAAYRLRFGRAVLPRIFRLDALVIFPVLLFWDALILLEAPLR